MESVPPSVLWTHVLPHLGASESTLALARTSMVMWRARPTRAQLIQAEAASLQQEAPCLFERMGGAEGVRAAATNTDLRFPRLVHTIRAIHGASPQLAYKTALQPLIDGSLIKPPAVGGGWRAHDTIAVLDDLLDYACAVAPQFRMWFAVLLFDYIRTCIPHVPELRDSPMFCAAAMHIACGSVHPCQGRPPRAVVRRLEASVRRLVCTLQYPLSRRA